MGNGSEIVMLAGLPEPVFWLWLSGAIFIIMALTLLAGPFRKERSELMTAFMGFLAGMGVFHILGGAAMYWNIPLLMYVASLAAITGSAFVLKFPLSAVISANNRKRLFYLALIIGWAIILYMLFNSYGMEVVMNTAAIYMIIVSGAISGFYMVAQGFRINDPSTKIKCIGGGCSIVFCCFFTHIIVLTIGLTTLAKLFMVLTPITLVLSAYIARRFIKETSSSMPSSLTM